LGRNINRPIQRNAIKKGMSGESYFFYPTSFTLPEQLGLPPPGFEQVFVAAGLSSRSIPVWLHGVSDPPTVHVSVFFAETSLANEGARTTVRTAATPIAKNIVFAFINRDSNKYDKKVIGKG
jgi:hypothetical protein